MSFSLTIMALHTAHIQPTYKWPNLAEEVDQVHVDYSILSVRLHSLILSPWSHLGPRYRRNSNVIQFENKVSLCHKSRGFGRFSHLVWGLFKWWLFLVAFQNSGMPTKSLRNVESTSVDCLFTLLDWSKRSSERCGKTTTGSAYLVQISANL